MKRILTLITIVGLAFARDARSSVTLQFSNYGLDQIASGFANYAGVATDGMTWGIVVDTGNNGFAGSTILAGYDPYANPLVSGSLSFAGSPSDDYFIPSETFGDSLTKVTYNSILQAPEGDHGTILETTPGGITLGGGVTTGKQFALIWFDANTMNGGDHYGMFTYMNLSNDLTDNPVPSFILPVDTALQDYSALFDGQDPIRAASLTFAAVPEPSRAVLVLLGVGIAAFRRRRK